MKKGTTTTFGLRGKLVPFGNERRLFHVGVEHFAIKPALGDALHLALGGDGGVVVQVGAVADDEEARLGGRHAGGDFGGTAQEQFGHARVAAHRLAVVDAFAIALGGRAGEPKLARDDRARKIPFGDEIRHDEYLGALHHVKHLAQARFFFPESALHLRENPAPGNRFRMIEASARSSPGSRSSRGPQ